MISRFGMIECGKNYKGTLDEICKKCSNIDDEDHRLNYCEKFRETNRFNDDVKIDFREIYSNDVDTLIKGYEKWVKMTFFIGLPSLPDKPVSRPMI